MISTHTKSNAMRDYLARENELRKKLRPERCFNWRTYRAHYYPTCNKGDPCDYCLAKWRNKNLVRVRRRKIENRITGASFNRYYDLTHWVEDMEEGLFVYDDQMNTTTL